jgi:hypothetical protein
MAIIDILSAAQGGGYFASAARAAGLSEDDARAAISALAPAIAERLKAKAAKDPEAFDQLLDLLEDGGDSSDLDDAAAMTGAEALSDGRAILDDLYGSRSQAAAALGKIAPHMQGDALDKVSALSATSVLAALAASNAATLASTPEAGGSSGGGILSIILGALLKGFLQSASRQIAPKRRRRRTGYSYSRRPARRRRTRRPGLDDIFRDILTSRR